MSTDMQKYSIDNQEAIIALYAASRGLDIVRTYADEGRSGLKFKGRAGLRRLIEDVRGGVADFDTILVYDVSRWGRFQDADESAYYEFICREAGISVRYCAEEFDNDGSITATILKTIKRAMAAEYSRELSSRVFIGKCNMVRRGFRHGGVAGFGLRRMVVDERGTRKGTLEYGQQKFLHTDRTILVPGPSDEVQTVRWIFERFTRENVTFAEIARDLNARGIKNGIGRPWVGHAVRGLIANEKYIGNNVFNQTSVKLKSKCVRNPYDLWVRADGAFESIVDKEIFEQARTRLAAINSNYTEFELLDRLSAVWCRHAHSLPRL
jgi:DNA invertase Pin-like site-specific DNA recombinase